jgi:hypothetical protein
LHCSRKNSSLENNYDDPIRAPQFVLFTLAFAGAINAACADDTAFEINIAGAITIGVSMVLALERATFVVLCGHLRARLLRLRCA